MLGRFSCSQKSGLSGTYLYQSWRIVDKDLTLQNIWDKFEEHCKPQTNELRAHYNLLKKLTQATLSCDQFIAAIQNQLSLCQYPTETCSILERNIFSVWILTRYSCQKSLIVKTLLLIKYDKDSESYRVVGPLPNTSPMVMAIMQK